MNKSITIAAVLLGLALGTPAAANDDTPPRGLASLSDGSFSYQGYLEFEGVPANGDYYFRFSLYDTADDWIDALYDLVGPVTVTDGLFDIPRIQMGATEPDARAFWRKNGDLVKYLQIEVGEIEGNYTTLSPKIEVGTTPHALFSQYTKALTFPYVDSHWGSDFGDPETMISLTNELGGTLIELKADNTTNSPLLNITGALSDGRNFPGQNGAVRIDATDERVGLLTFAKEFPIVAIIPTPSAFSSAAIYGQIDSGVEGLAMWAVNLDSGNSAIFASPNYAGDFSGDVIARDNLRVQGEPTRDYASNSPSPIGPLAYASVNANAAVTSSTANISVTWDSVNLRYVVAVAGENMHFTTHTVSVSVVDTTEPRLATFNSFGGDILVKIWDLNSGNAPVQDNFSIVIYDANPVLLNRVVTPDGVDLDKYIEKTGITPIQTRPRHEPVEPRKAKAFGQQD